MREGRPCDRQTGLKEIPPEWQTRPQESPNVEWADDWIECKFDYPILRFGLTIVDTPSLSETKPEAFDKNLLTFLDTKVPIMLFVYSDVTFGPIVS